MCAIIIVTAFLMLIGHAEIRSTKCDDRSNRLSTAFHPIWLQVLLRSFHLFNFTNTRRIIFNEDNVIHREFHSWIHVGCNLYTQVTPIFLTINVGFVCRLILHFKSPVDLVSYWSFGCFSNQMHICTCPCWDRSDCNTWLD